MKKITYSLRIGIIGERNPIKTIFIDNLQKKAIESYLVNEIHNFLIIFKQIPIKIKIFIAKTIENLIYAFEKIDKLDIIILALNLHDPNSLNNINKYVVEDFNEIFLFQGLSVLVGMDLKHILSIPTSKRFKISRFQLEKTTKDLGLIYCFEIFNKDKDVNEIYNTLFNDFILRFQYSNPELFETAKNYGKTLI
ncbi:MAG: hypothetical protein JSV62_13685 [Promethearchaeota archaeon]|nr:MAG: hypothetical protein JSV62_13685 [Candidatus Lokiarchaeota archaeon]